MKNVLKPLAKSVLIPLGLTTAAIQRMIFRSCMTKISDKEINDTMEIIKSLKNVDLLIQKVSQTTENEAKEQKSGFLNMLLGTLEASLLENILTGKGVRCSKYLEEE